MMKTQWVLLVQHRSGRVSAEVLETAEAAEAAAYVAKIANPDARVSMHCDQRFGLLWERGAWHILVLKVEGRGPLCKRAADFASAHREHDILCQAGNATSEPGRVRRGDRDGGVVFFH